MARSQAGQNKPTTSRAAPKSAPSRRLRQPKMVKVKASAPAYIAPRVVPQTAQARRRRNTLEPVRTTTQTLLGILGSARSVSLAILVLCIYCLYLIGVNQRFYLNQIMVEGASNLSATEIIRASGLAGVHIFAANPKAAADAVSALPGVRAVTVELQWPQEVRIEVTEDAPVLLWEESGQRYWVNSAGEFVPAGNIAPAGLLRVTAETPPPAPTMAEATPQPETTAEATPFRPNTYLRFIPQELLVGAQQLTAIRPNIDQLFYTPYGGLSYQDGRGWRGYFGVGDNMTEKIAVYEAITADLIGRGITPAYINVNNPARPYYRTP